MTGRPTWMKFVLGAMAVLLGIGFTASLFQDTPLFTTGGAEDPTEERIAEAKEQLQKNPNDEDALRDLATGYLTLSRPDEEGNEPADAAENRANAIETYKRLRELRPNERDYGLGLAEAYREDENYEQAQKVYAQLAKQDPNDADLFLALGQSAQQAGDIKTAISAYQQVIKLEPNHQFAEELKQQIKQLKNPEAAPQPANQ